MIDRIYTAFVQRLVARALSNQPLSSSGKNWLGRTVLGIKPMKSFSECN